MTEPALQREACPSSGQSRQGAACRLQLRGLAGAGAATQKVKPPFRRVEDKNLALPPARMQWLWLEHAVPLDRRRQELPEDMRMPPRGARIDENEAAKFPCCPTSAATADTVRRSRESVVRHCWTR